MDKKVNHRNPMRGNEVSSCFWRWRRLGIVLSVCVVTLYSQNAIAGKKYALVVGISEFAFGAQQTGVVDLQFADDDAIAIGKKLQNASYILVEPLTNRDAEREEILAELVRMRGYVEEEDFVIVYFAGHGVRDPTNGKTYLLANDTRLSNIEDRGIRLDHFMDYIHDLKAKRKLILLDHCYSGEIEYVPFSGSSGARVSVVGSGVGLKPRGVLPVQAEIESIASGIGEGTVVIAATGSGASLLAFEHESLGHGFFTQAILDAVESNEADTIADGELEITELINYLPIRMQELTQEYLGINQVPKIVMNNVVNLSSWEPILPLNASADLGDISSFVELLNLNNHLSPKVYLFTQVAIAEFDAKHGKLNSLTDRNRKAIIELRELHSLFESIGDSDDMLLGYGRVLTVEIKRIFGVNDD